MGISVWQILVVLLIVLILFGAGKLPRVMGDIAKGVKSFKSGLKDDGDDESESTSRPRTLEGHGDTPANKVRRRSEEHTSELQSLMRISYAVFCLKKKNKDKQIARSTRYT